jgi:hypothetical protein
MTGILTDGENAHLKVLLRLRQRFLVVDPTRVHRGHVDARTHIVLRDSTHQSYGDTQRARIT